VRHALGPLLPPPSDGPGARRPVPRGGLPIPNGDHVFRVPVGFVSFMLAQRVELEQGPRRTTGVPVPKLSDGCSRSCAGLLGRLAGEFQQLSIARMVTKSMKIGIIHEPQLQVRTHLRKIDL
jgi:hypothetical protein